MRSPEALRVELADEGRQPASLLVDDDMRVFVHGMIPIIELKDVLLDQYLARAAVAPMRTRSVNLSTLVRTPGEQPRLDYEEQASTRRVDR